MHIAHIAQANYTEKPKKLTAKQQLHNDAVAQMIYSGAMNQRRAEKMFESETAEVERLERKYNINVK